MSSEQQASTAPDGKPLSEQPRWRRDFPIDRPRDEFVARRDFTRFMVLTSFAFVVGQWWIVAKNFFRRRAGALPIVPIARLDELPVGGSKQFFYPGEHDAAVLIRLTQDFTVAYHRACTHLLCPVVPQPEQKRLHCPCHNGNFDIRDGRPISGPPERPLPRVLLEVRNGTIYAVGMEVRGA